ASFIKVVNELDQSYDLPDDLGGLVIHEAEPDIELRIAGSTRALQAQLTALYPEDVRVPLGQVHSSASDFPLFSAADGAWLLRNPESESTAMARLMRDGFQQLDATGMLFLRGEDETVDFLTASLPDLREKWFVETDDKLVHVESGLGRIEPKIESSGGGQGSGADWLAYDVSWQCGGETLDRESVRRLLASGNRTMKLPRGGKAVISQFDAEVMDGFLLDTDPRQDGGAYFFPKGQTAYVEQLRSHYSDSEREADQAEVPTLPSDLGDILRPYQQEGVEWLYRRASGSGGALLADDMGLGKTLQTLAFIALWKKQHPEPTLVVCPATLLGNWRAEAEKFVPGLNVLVMHGSKRKDYFEVLHAADIIVTSYALLDRDTDVYRKLPLSALVLDEASAIRNPDTLAAKAARKVQAAARIAITGTPVENSVRDLWSIFQFLMPGYLGGREDFRRRYELPCAAEVPDQSTRAAMQRLRWRTAPFMLRRTKSLVAKDLPPKIESVVWCDPSPMQADHYQSILRHGAEKVDALRKQSGNEGARMQMLTVLLRLRQSCCDLRLLDEQLAKKPLADVSAKMVRLMELLGEATRGGHRVLVFSQFTSMLSLIRNGLENEGIKYSYLDGATRDRSAEVEGFQKPDGPPVFLISLKAGGYGLTLTAADTVVLFDPWWNPAVEAQAADRIHRIGQTRPATIYKFITRGTVEEKILRLQEKKKSMTTAAMGEADDDARPMMTGLSEGEMLDLLEG
ncbi:MAG: DEAD/DEAH box helicase, partial [Akkermansiaceae bacterium]